MKKILGILVLIGAIVGVTYVLKPEQAVSPTNGIDEQEKIASQEAVVSPDYVKYFGVEDKTALELLQSTTEIEYTQYDFGAFVESINSVKPDDRHFWKFYINGQEAQVGADQLQTKNGDVIEWKLEQIITN